MHIVAMGGMGQEHGPLLFYGDIIEATTQHLGII